MNLPTILRVNLLCFAIILLQACQKDVSSPNSPVSPKNTTHLSGAVPDNPVKLATVPLIISSQFLNGKRIDLLSPQSSGARGGKPRTGGDVTPPSVNIASPANGASVSGSVTVAVSASDNVSVSSVSLAVDGALIGTVTVSPYTFIWNSSSAVDGTHTLTAKAIDGSGNSSTSTIVVSKNATITTLPPSSLPPNSFLQMPPVGDQGAEGSCAVFATTYAARSIEQFYKTNATSYSYATNIFSPEFVYNQTKVLDCGSGTGVTTALDFMINTGVCTWQSMPYSYSNGCSLLPSAAQSAEAVNYKIRSYAKIVNSDVTSIKSMVVNRHPVIITVNPDDAFNSATPGFVWRSYSGAAGLSHNIVICGYDDSKHAYKIMNSWGIGWGDSGFSWIDYDFLPQASFYYCYVITG